MVWTYNPALLEAATTAGAVTRVRLALGDNNANDQLFQDEELRYFITKRASEYGACADAARALSARFSGKVDSSIGDLRGSFSQKQQQWHERALEFESLSALSGGMIPYCGGISKSDMQRVEANTDRVPPQFTIGMNDSNLPVGPVPTPEPEIP